MKNIFILVTAFTLLLEACNNSSPSSVKSEVKDTAKTSVGEALIKETRNRNVVTQSLDAFKLHDVDAALKNADANCIDYGDGTMPPVKGADSIKSAIKAWMTAFPDVKGDDFVTVADGDWVIVHGRWEGTWKANFMGQKATGKSYKVYDADIFKLSEEGKIKEHHNIQSGVNIGYMIGMKVPLGETNAGKVAAIGENPIGTHTANEERNIKVIQQSLAGFNAHDVAAFLKDASDNMVEYWDGLGKPTIGKDSIIKSWAPEFEIFGNVRGYDLKYFAQGDWVMVWGRWTGIWKKSSGSQKATGKPYDNVDLDVFKLSEDGKILEHHATQTGIIIAMQTGYKLK